MEQLARISQNLWVVRSSDNLHYYRDECRHSKMLSSRLSNAIQD